MHRLRSPLQQVNIHFVILCVFFVPTRKTMLSLANDIINANTIYSDSIVYTEMKLRIEISSTLDAPRTVIYITTVLVKQMIRYLQ